MACPGEPTEIAIQVFASRFSWDRGRLPKGEDAKWTQKVEFPFDSDVKRMTVVYTDNTEKKSVAFAKGSVERILRDALNLSSNKVPRRVPFPTSIVSWS